MLRSWINSIYTSKGTNVEDIVTYERVNTIDNVCHDREGYPNEFFYVYMAFFIQLHVRLHFNEFTMGVQRILNLTPTQLHPNS